MLTASLVTHTSEASKMHPATHHGKSTGSPGTNGNLFYSSTEDKAAFPSGVRTAPLYAITLGAIHAPLFSIKLERLNRETAHAIAHAANLFGFIYFGKHKGVVYFTQLAHRSRMTSATCW